MFHPDKALGVQVTVNHTETSDKSYVYDAVVSWVENVNYDRFTACMMAASYNERDANANVTVDWMVYQGHQWVELLMKCGYRNGGLERLVNRQFSLGQ